MTILNTLDSLGKFDGKVDKGFLVRYSVSIKAFRKTNEDVAFDEKEPEFDEKKHESKVNVSPSSSAQSKKYDDKTKREAKGKSPIESLTEYRNISAEFEDFFDNNINEINAAGHTQEEGIDYEEVFAPVARIEAIRLFLAYASFMGIMVYQMDVKSIFLYGTIEEEVYVCQPLGFEDLDYPDKVYKVVKALYGLHQAPRACQDKYVAEILRKFGLTDGKSASTPIDTEKPLLKDPDGEDKQTVMATSSNEAEYVAAASCCAQVLWNQNQLLDYGYTLLDCIFLGFGLTMHVVLSGMESLKKMLHVTNILSAGYLTTPQMVLNSPCLTHIKNWLVQIKRSLDKRQLVKKSQIRLWQVNDVTRLQALVDKKKVVVMEASIRDALCLDDAEGVKCLPNEEIFAELSRMGKQVDDLASHSTKYTSPALTQKVFANMRRVHEMHVEDVNAAGVATKGVVSAIDDVIPTVVAEPSILSPTSPTPPPQPSQDIHSTSQDKIAQALEITKLKQRVKKLEKRNKLKDVVLDDAKDATVGKSADVEDNADIQGRTAESQAQIYQIDLEHANKVLSMQDEEESEPIKLQKVVDVVTTAKIITEVVSATSDTITIASTTITAADVPMHAATTTAAPILIAAPSRRRNGVTKEKIDEEDSKALKRLNESQEDKVAKKQQLDKEIYNENNTPYYKIKRADSSHQLYLSFLSLLRNFDREDLEALWRLVKEIFATIKPKNFSDDFMLITHGAMFEKPDIHAQIWKNQRSVHGQEKVKIWKLLESCGV
nr:copia protein [Tanacetum cinerariifolium]